MGPPDPSFYGIKDRTSVPGLLVQPTDLWCNPSLRCKALPAGWPPVARCVVRRLRVGRDELRSDSRSRRRRTIDPNQLTLLEEGEIGYAYAYSFIVTNLAGDVIDIEAWFRMRPLVEERIKDSKREMALRHPSSVYESVNRTWT